jgi:dCMP deaminase
MRLDWDGYFMDIARRVAERSTCDRAHVGCVLVRDNRVLATGYNGSVSGMPHCDDVGHDIVNGHCKRTIHAEMNAIIQCAIHGVSSKGAIVYVTHYPCYDCAKALVNAGVLVVNYEQTYGVFHDVFERIGVWCIL